MNCAYLFYQSYIELVPQKLHIALPKGTLVHLILELLIDRYDYVNQILQKKTIAAVPSVYRLVRKNLKKAGLDDHVTLKEIESWVLVGLNADYFCSGAPEIRTEEQFEIDLDGIKVTGTIDKIGVFKDKIIIQDYKSSKQKFSGEDKEANIQAMLYLWAVRKLFPGKKSYEFRFVFLRFPRNPVQEHSYTENQIEGFSSWANYIIKIMADMDEISAYSNFAADDRHKSWLCKAGKTWKCPYMDGFEYYHIVDQSGEFVSAVFQPPLDLQEGYSAIKKLYKGCPRFDRSREKDAANDFLE